MIGEDKQNDLYAELSEIKKLLRQVLDTLQNVHELEQDIKMYEGKQTLEEQKIASAMKKKRFTSIFEWKNAIWEHCPNKKEQVGRDMVSFYCTLLHGACKFEECPRNLVDVDPYSLSKPPL